MSTDLLADDDVELSLLLGEYLEQEGFLVRRAHDFEHAQSDLERFAIDVVVLDITMPRMNGLEFLRLVHRKRNVPVLVLTARGDEIDGISGLDLGADDHVAKPGSPGELAARIRAILRRADGSTRSQGIQRRDLLSINPPRRIATWNGDALQLTSIEFNILEVLASHAGELVSRAELSLQAVGQPITRYDRSLDVHISAIRHKLGSFPGGRSPFVGTRGLESQLLVE